MIGTVAGGLLFCYSLRMAYDEGYLVACGGPNGDDDDDDDDDDDEASEPSAPERLLRAGLMGCDAGVDYACACVADEGDDDAKAPLTSRPKRDVVVVAFLGSMDDFVVYFSVALSGDVGFVDLVIGTTIGAVLIACVVGALLESSESVAACVERIPVPVVLAVLAVYIVTFAWIGSPSGIEVRR